MFERARAAKDTSVVVFRIADARTQVSDESASPHASKLAVETLRGGAAGRQAGLTAVTGNVLRVARTELFRHDPAGLPHTVSEVLMKWVVTACGARPASQTKSIAACTGSANHD